MKRIMSILCIVFCICTALEAGAALCTGGTSTALQACLNTARTTTDKTVDVQGTWTITQQIWVPHFVTLRGLGTFHDGTKFEITYGSGVGTPATDGTVAAIMLAKSSILDGIVLEYPNQSPVDSAMYVYAPAVGLWNDGGAPGVWNNGTEILDEVRIRNCTFSGAYAGVVAVIPTSPTTPSFFNDLVIENCWWRRYYRGIVMDGCVDVCKVVGVHAKSDQYTAANGEFITAGRVDGLWIDRTFAYGPYRFFHAMKSAVSTIPLTGLRIRSSLADTCGTSCITISTVDTSPQVPAGVMIEDSEWISAPTTNTHSIWINGIPKVIILGNTFSTTGQEAVHIVNSSSVNVVSNLAFNYSQSGSGYSAFYIANTTNGNVALNLCSNPGTGAGPCITATGNTNVVVSGVTTP